MRDECSICAVSVSASFVAVAEGASSRVGYRPSFGSDSISASSATLGRRGRVCREQGVEFLELPLRRVVVGKLRQRAQFELMIGYSGLSVCWGEQK